jgi:ketosteroid isomerase-like protein
LTQNLQKIRQYYERIDANDVEWVVALFADDAVYERAGSHYRGIPAIREFFAVHRKIRGVHRVEKIWPVGDAGVVVVIGHFEGVGANGDPRSVGFSDFWHFNDDGQVSKRQSYLSLGHEYVRQ